MGFDQLFRKTHCVGCVLHHQQIEFFVDKQIACLDDCADHIHRLLHVGIGEIKAARYKFLIFLEFCRRIGIDQNRVFIDHLSIQLIGQQYEFDHVIHGAVPHHNRGLKIGTHVFVKNKIDPRSTGYYFEYIAQVGIAKLQRDRFTHSSL